MHILWDSTTATHIDCPGRRNYNPPGDATETCFGTTLANAMKSDIVNLVYDKVVTPTTVVDYGFVANGHMTATQPFVVRSP